MNFGVGDRIQLTYQVPYDVEDNRGGRSRSGWGNAFSGVKWRFLDQGVGGWQASMFPQFETGGSARAIQAGIASAGPRFLLPIEVARSFGKLGLNLEYGQYFPQHGPRERFVGVVTGRPLTSRLELDAEIYNDRATDAPNQTILDVGGRYAFRPGLNWLFMAGSSLNGASTGDTEFTGYVGIQILLTDYGLKFNANAD